MSLESAHATDAPAAATRSREHRGAPLGCLPCPRVCRGTDPVSKQPHYLEQTIPAGDGALKVAEKTLTKFLNQVDEKRNPRTTATVNQLLDRWLEVLDVEVTTRRGCLTKINKHIRPLLGDLQVARVDVEVLDSFYAALRRCETTVAAAGVTPASRCPTPASGLPGWDGS